MSSDDNHDDRKSTETSEEKSQLLPVELAIKGEKDDVAAFLIRIMSHER